MLVEITKESDIAVGYLLVTVLIPREPARSLLSCDSHQKITRTSEGGKTSIGPPIALMVSPKNRISSSKSKRSLSCEPCMWEDTRWADVLE